MTTTLRAPVTIRFAVNGREVEAAVEGGRRLLDVLRLDLGLTGTKEGCGEGECGSCTVLLDGAPVNACLVAFGQCAGRSVTTVEGLADERLAPLQQAFLDKGAVQCGFCIPGQLLSAHALLADNPHPSLPEIQEGLAGNLCRCGCYRQITDAVLATAERAER